MLSTAYLIVLFWISNSLVRAEEVFGHKLREQFILEDGYTNLNHGSYGLAPKPVLAAQRQWRTLCESNPDKFYRYQVYDYLDNARAVAASVINANVSDVVIIDNASEGMNAILRSLVQPHSGVLYLDFAYFMVAETLRYLRDTIDAQLVEINTESLFPVTSEASFAQALVTAFRDAIQNSTTNSVDIKLCVIDHISSMPSLVLPVQQLAQVCREAGALVAVDGAHAIGNIKVDINNLGADVYVSNGHKWYFTPKGSALLWVSPELQGSTTPYQEAGQAVYPTVVSFEGQGESPFAKLFSWEGTKDYGAFLSFPTASLWRQQLGDDAILNYLHSLSASGGDLLASSWATTTLVPSGLTQGDGSMLSAMSMIELPTANCTQAAQLPQMLLGQYNTWVPTIEFAGLCWVRVSAQIYNDISDYAMLAAAVPDLLAQLQ